MLETLTVCLLWSVATVGTWNAMTMINRICGGERWSPYLSRVFTGALAGLILLLR